MATKKTTKKSEIEKKQVKKKTASPKKKVVKKTAKKKEVKKTPGKRELQRLAKLEKERLEDIFDQFETVVSRCLKYVEDTSLESDQVLFAYLCALPKDLKPNRNDIAKRLKVTTRTLDRWKHNSDFRMLRSQFMIEILKDRTPEVLENLYKGAVKSGPFGVNTAAIKLWLQYIEQFKEGQNIDLTSKGDKVQVVFGFDKSEFMKPEDEKKKDK